MWPITQPLPERNFNDQSVSGVESRLCARSSFAALTDWVCNVWGHCSPAWERVLTGTVQKSYECTGVPRRGSAPPRSSNLLTTGLLQLRDRTAPGSDPERSSWWLCHRVERLPNEIIGSDPSGIDADEMTRSSFKGAFVLGSKAFHDWENALLGFRCKQEKEHQTALG